MGDRAAWLALAVTTLVFFLSVIDISAVNVAFPSIRDDFERAEAMAGEAIEMGAAALLVASGCEPSAVLVANR